MRYTGPRCRKCRELGFSVCGSERCALLRRTAPPGIHAPSRRKPSDYKKQLMEKQKLRYTYWVGERQFRKTVKKAFDKPGGSGENLLQLLERRLDNIVYRLGFAATRLAAQQMVSHGHILVNGRKVDKPSYLVSPGEIVSVRDKDKKMQVVQEGVLRHRSRPELPFLETDTEQLEGKMTEIPSRSQIPLPVDETLVVEYYARHM